MVYAFAKLRYVETNFLGCLFYKLETFYQVVNIECLNNIEV